MTSRSERVHSHYLFPAIVCLLVAQPVVASLTATNSGILAIPLTATLVAGVWSLDDGRVWFRLAIFLGLGVLVALASNAMYPQRLWLLPVVAFLAALGVISISLGIRWLFVAPRVSVASLLAAMSVYLLIGITFGILNVAIYTSEPGWYQGVSPAGDSAETAELVYYSLGVLTGTAFGDVLPLHPIPRLLSNIEAVAGQMYVAVLVAMLVSGYATDRGGPGARS